MNNLSEITVILALIGSLLVAGIFFAFSSFIMKALARLPSSGGMADDRRLSGQPDKAAACHSRRDGGPRPYLRKVV